MLIDKEYLALPVTYRMANKKVKFYENGKLIYDMDASLDPVSPRAVAYYDIKRFMGKDLEIVVDPDIGYTPELADAPVNPELYHEKYRPQVHFTAQFGWLNDPNGLVKVGDTYHLFFQHNPLLWRWGNMHWGHAVSTDLFHWKELDHALFPDEMGTMYSGSGIIDRDNVTGLGTRDNPAVLFFYTAASKNSIISETGEYTQCLAYSLDGGMTLKKYEGNPIIENIEGCNRDPKVVWCAPLGKYLMSLYLADNRFTLLSSTDMIHWNRFQDLEMQGEAECPDMFPIRADDGKDLWCIYGASTKYLVGDFKDGKFVATQEIKTLRNSDYGYAGQTYSDLENGRRVLVLWQCLDMGTDPICGQMSVPMDLALKKDGNEYYLTANPVAEIEALRKSRTVKEGISLCGDKKEFGHVGKDAVDVTLKFPYEKGKKFRLSMFGAQINVDMDKNYVCIYDRYEKVSANENGMCEVRIILDRCTVEIFTDGGRYPLCMEHMADMNLDTLTVEGEIENLTVEYSPLASIWG